jgi:hypothetical protein
MSHSGSREQAQAARRIRAGAEALKRQAHADADAETRSSSDFFGYANTGPGTRPDGTRILPEFFLYLWVIVRMIGWRARLHQVCTGMTGWDLGISRPCSCIQFVKKRPALHPRVQIILRLSVCACNQSAVWTQSTYAGDMSADSRETNHAKCFRILPVSESSISR